MDPGGELHMQGHAGDEERRQLTVLGWSRMKEPQLLRFMARPNILLIFTVNSQRIAVDTSIESYHSIEVNVTWSTNRIGDGHMEHSGRFTGRIGKTLADSVSSWEEKTSRLKRKPNIVMIVLDDVGYANFGCYGGDIETPALDSLAEDGLQYTNFHVTPLCSPTRTCLLTGRNHHSLGMGRVAEMDNGFPNTRGFAARDAANLAEILRPQGYQTLAVGKWHLVAVDDTSPAGPYDHWPLQRGFDRYFGFLPGEANQWNPELILGNERVQQPDREGYHFSEDIVDHACLWLRQLASADPEKPFFLYLAFGAGHSPHHAPPEYMEKYRGRFDDGWDAARERTIERQRASGLMPPDQALAPTNPGVPAWDELDADEKRVAARFQEAFAGFIDHTDDQIGRLLKQLDELGKQDDTLVLAICDNGASSEGGRYGSYDQQRSRSGLRTSVAENLERLDDIDGPLTNNQYPFGWAMAGNTPFKRYKGQTYGGGACASADPLARWHTRTRRKATSILPCRGRDAHHTGRTRIGSAGTCRRHRADTPSRRIDGAHIRRR